MISSYQHHSRRRPKVQVSETTEKVRLCARDTAAQIGRGMQGERKVQGRQSSDLRSGLTMLVYEC